MFRKPEVVKMIFFIIVIIIFINLLVVIIRNGVEERIADRTYMLQTETLNRKAFMISKSFENGHIILRKSVENAQNIMKKGDAEEDTLYNINEYFFDKVLYVTPNRKIIGDTKEYATEFIGYLENVLQSKEDVVALKNGDMYFFVYVFPVNNNKSDGAFLGLYASKRIDAMLTDNNSGKLSRTIVSFSDGTVITKSNGAINLNKGNSFSNILSEKAKSEFYSEKEYQTVVDNMKDESLKSFNYRMRGTNGTTLVSVVRVNSTPFLITQYLQSIKTMEMEMESNIFYNILIVLALLFLFFIIATQVYNFKKRQILKKQMKLDHMTGLLNHNAAMDAIERDIINNNSGALMILDIDEFKTINDTYGHLFGDIVIKRVSGCISDSFQNGEILGRFGGDEFVIYIPNEHGDANILQKAEELIYELNRLDFYNDCKVCGSIGIAICHSNDMSASTLFKYADEAMYQAKNRGKNQCVLYKQQ